jgi:hypothetical protein
MVVQYKNLEAFVCLGILRLPALKSQIRDWE